MISRSEIALSESGLLSLEISRGENEQNIDAALEVAREKLVDPDVEWCKVEINLVKDHAVMVSWSQPIRPSIRERLLEQVP
jgi:hypothetical protein